MSKKVALLGGAFNPIHKGHLYLASQFQAQFPDVSLCFIPSGASAHKSNLDLASNEDRLAMVELALTESSLLSPFVSPIELKREGISYTIDTVRELKREYGETTTFFLLIGDDLLEGLPRWKAFNQLRQEVTFVVAYRESFPSYQIQSLKNRYPEFLFLENKIQKFSSTQVREKIAIGEGCGEALPNALLNFIQEKKLYRANNPNADCQGAFAYMQKQLSPSRLEHCYRVAKEASRLASLYGLSSLCAYQAGFFHDIARSMEISQMVTLGKKYIQHFQRQREVQGEGELTPIVDYEENQLILYHAQAGAWLLQEEFGFSDSDFLEAVAFHTAGKPQMGSLAQLVFVADFTEPGRSFDNHYWHQLAGKVSLNRLVWEVAKASVAFDKEAGRKTIPSLNEMLVHLQQELKNEKV